MSGQGLEEHRVSLIAPQNDTDNVRELQVIKVCDAEVFMGILLLCLGPADPFGRGGLVEAAGFGSRDPRGSVKSASAAGERVSSPYSRLHEVFLAA
jgi:hypothetical protein